jgi:hypothetical protein
MQNNEIRQSDIPLNEGLNSIFERLSNMQVGAETLDYKNPEEVKIIIAELLELLTDLTYEVYRRTK